MPIFEYTIYIIIMRKIFFILYVLFYIPLYVVADTYPEVIFDNSLVKGAYAKSKVEYQGYSWVENVNKQLLVSDTLYFTPGNALSLKYNSHIDGNWKADIRYSRQKFHYRVVDSDMLSFMIYVKSKETNINDLPRILINQFSGASEVVSVENYITNYGTGKWIQVKIPVKRFNLQSRELAITSISLLQNRTSTHTHHVFIDQIEFLPQKYSDIKLTAAAVLTEAVAYDRMVHLKWQLPLTPSIRYIKIYRSEDGEVFTPISIRPIHMQSCLDVVPQIGGKYYYKITWVDYNYKESAFSTVREAQTKPSSDESIIDLIQLTHVNYFVENFDVNSGMYLPYRSKEKPIVSTKETAGAVLSLIIGAERKFINRQTAFNRISKIAYFLLKAQHVNGIFPAHFDGRKGLPEYRKGTASYDVEATSSLIESLLIAREYFDKDDENERDLRNRITELYQAINWQKIMMNGEHLILKSKLKLVDDQEQFQNQNFALTGPNSSINAYLLGISSAKFPLAKQAYYDGVFHSYNAYTYEKIDDVEIDIYADSAIYEQEEYNTIPAVVFVDTIARNPIIDPIQKYGVNLSLGEYHGSMIDMYEPFWTIKPDLLKDSLLNWRETIQSYVQYVKRRDNETGVGVNNSDIWGFYQHRDSIGGYRINPAISSSAVIVDPKLGIDATLALYQQYGHILFTEYGFRAWLDLRNEDVSDEYFARNQASIAIMLENYKSGLIWRLYEKIPELKNGRQLLFTHKN